MARPSFCAFGVLGVINEVKIKPQVHAPDVRSKIKAALEHNAQIDADAISISAAHGMAASCPLRSPKRTRFRPARRGTPRRDKKADCLNARGASTFHNLSINSSSVWPTRFKTANLRQL